MSSSQSATVESVETKLKEKLQATIAVGCRTADNEALPNKIQLLTIFCCSAGSD